MKVAVLAAVPGEKESRSRSIVTALVGKLGSERAWLNTARPR